MATIELADKLSARGFSADALNGDIEQKTRERIVEKLKTGKTDILIATDVAARGLDVERISHVVNYDIPYDTESYIHRIGRTGRAGREGHAILFVAHRERRLLNAIEKATKQSIERMDIPTVSYINEQRVNRFKQQINDTIASQDMEFYIELISSYQEQHEHDLTLVAAALAKMVSGEQDLLLKEKKHEPREKSREWEKDSDDGRGEKRNRREKVFSAIAKPLKDHPDIKMERYRLEVGRKHKVKVSNIVGAIANEADIDSEYIGQIELYEEFSTVDLPADMPNEILAILKQTRIAGRASDISVIGSMSGDSHASKGKNSKTHARKVKKNAHKKKS